VTFSPIVSPSKNRKAFRTSRKANNGERVVNRSSHPSIAYWHPSQSRLSGSKRYIVLRPHAHTIHFLGQVSQILAARNEINLRGIHNDERRLIILQKKLVVPRSHL